MTIAAAQRGDEAQVALVAEAVAAVRRGWRVVPLHGVRPDRSCTCGRQPCPSPGKHPLWKGWQDNPISDEKGVVRALAHTSVRGGQPNYGILTGDGLVALDRDDRNGGDDSLAVLEHDQGRLPPTPTDLTPGGGAHFFLATPPGLRLASGPLAPGRFPGLDVKAEGGFVVGPGSLHHSGRRYEWEASSHPDDVPIAGMPNWLSRMAVGRGGSRGRRGWGRPDGDGRAPGWRVQRVDGGEADIALWPQERAEFTALLRTLGVEVGGREGEGWRLCPFHPDRRHPNLHVDPVRGLYHCFACGAGGSLDDLRWAVHERSREKACEGARESSLPGGEGRLGSTENTGTSVRPVLSVIPEVVTDKTGRTYVPPQPLAGPNAEPESSYELEGGSCDSYDLEGWNGKCGGSTQLGRGTWGRVVGGPCDNFSCPQCGPRKRDRYEAHYAACFEGRPIHRTVIADTGKKTREAIRGRVRRRGGLDGRYVAVPIGDNQLAVFATVPTGASADDGEWLDDPTAAFAEALRANPNDGRGVDGSREWAMRRREAGKGAGVAAGEEDAVVGEPGDTEEISAPEPECVSEASVTTDHSFIVLGYPSVSVERNAQIAADMGLYPEELPEHALPPMKKGFDHYLPSEAEPRREAYFRAIGLRPPNRTGRRGRGAAAGGQDGLTTAGS